MKYTLLAISLLCAVLAFCIVNTIAVGRICSNVSTAIDAAESAMKTDSSNIGNQCQSISGIWEKHSRYISVVSHHESAEEAETEINAMCAAAEQKNSNDFFLHSAQAKSLLEHISDEEKLRFSNIF